MEEVVVVCICLILNAFFAAYEMAFVSVPRSQLRALAKEGDDAAQTLLSFRENPERILSIIQIGITLVGVIAAAVGGVGAGESIEPYLMETLELSERAAELLSIVMVVLPIAYLSVVVGELVPKSLALRNPLRIVLSGSRVLFVVNRLFSPFISLLEWSTKTILSIFFPRLKKPLPQSHESLEIDTFSPIHRRYILNMAEIERRKIKDVLLPWAQVVFVEKEASLEEVFQTIVSSGHTRLPVKDKGKIVGVLHTKEFIALKESGGTEWASIIRPVLIVRSTDSALGVMRLLQIKRNHMAIVVQSTGERLGIVTMEDILEEVVGDMYDEDDDSQIRKIYTAKIKGRYRG